MTTVIKQPSTTVSIANANQAIQNTPQRILVVGQLNGGTAASGTLIENVGDDFEALFGADSIVAGIVRAIRRVNPVNRVDAIPLDDDVGGTARVIDFTVSGTATAAGTITIDVGSRRDHRYVVSIVSGATATAAAAALVAAINADTRVPFTASNVAGAVTLTAVNAGLVANDLGVEIVDVDVAGLSIGSLVETTAGAGDPTLTGVLDVATERYQGIVWPYSDLTALQAYLTPRFNPTNAVLDGVGFVPLVDTHANLITTLDALNDQNIVAVVDEDVTGLTQYQGPAMNEKGYMKAGYLAGIRALRLTADQAIGQFVVSSASLDQFGGTALASLPLFNTPISFLPLIPAGRGFTDTEIEQLHDSGGTVIGNNIGGTSAIVGEVVTTYKTDAASNPDVTFKYLNYVDTASAVREYYFNNLRATYAQTRLTEGALARGRDMANATSIAAFLDKLYGDLAGPDFVLVQDGEEAIRFFKQNRTVTLDLSQGKATITMLVPIVVQLRVIIATVKIAFSTES